MSRAARVLERLFKGIEWTCVVLLTAMVLVVSIQVGARFLLNRTPDWSEELAQVMTIWFGFLGAAVLVRTGGHMALEFAVSRLPEKVQDVIEVIVGLLIGAFALYMVIWGAMLVGRFWGQPLPGTGIPVGLSYLPIPLSGVLMVLALLSPLIRQESGQDAGAGQSPALLQKD